MQWLYSVWVKLVLSCFWFCLYVSRMYENDLCRHLFMHTCCLGLFFCYLFLSWHFLIIFQLWYLAIKYQPCLPCLYSHIYKEHFCQWFFVIVWSFVNRHKHSEIPTHSAYEILKNKKNKMVYRCHNFNSSYIQDRQSEQVEFSFTGTPIH